uniref:Large ribosomal subunit protein uL3c n=1 Tax=Porolithon onkodes TaxID=231751 RepID=A0A2Z2KS60_9FLOR|nr:ribosomal protein L3 [Porolithon onkodes]ASB29718.1 ribosomal protein L3 [Porolithon onkodes]
MTSIGLLGKKIGMTQIFDNIGHTIPVTILQIGPCFVTEIKTIEKHGYNAVQVGYGIVKNQNLKKSELGHLIKSNLPSVKYLKEFRIESSRQFYLGEEIHSKDLQIGDYIDVQGKNIGKGFTGYQKRHKFTRGPMSHGSKNHRLPGSIGAGTTPGRVFPGKKMAGRSGNKKVTVKNLEIIDINQNNYFILVRGSVPGKNGNLISIKKK